MARPKHTPGPWTLEDPLGPEILSIVAGGPEVYDWTHIAQVSAEGRREDGDPTEPVARANARLIAASPDMLAALKAMIAEWEKFTRYGSPIAKAANESVIAARAAIAKAEASV